MKSRKFKSFLFLVVLFTAITFSCDDSMPDPIYGTKPTVAFTATQSASDIFTWSFTNSSSGAISYNWDFGDGNGSSEANPSHTYAGAGSFTVTLTATATGTSNALGWRESASQAVQIDLPTYESADVTFSVDMKNANLTSTDVVKLTGSFEGWSGPNSPHVMSDDDGNGVYEVTVPLTTNEAYEYKFIINDWGNQEQFGSDDECALTSDGTYYNRPLTLGNLEETVTLNTACFNSCEDCLDIPGTLVGTWKLSGYKVGPNADDGAWWTFDGNGRDCHIDDTFTFTSAGGFEMDLGSETWLEGWQGVDEGCGAPIAPHVSSTSHTYVLAGTSTLTVTGDGAFIGLAKAHNTGEDGKSGGAITYEIFDITPTTMKLTLDYSGGNKTNFWTIELVKQ
jgi:PKD repeat protein